MTFRELRAHVEKYKGGSFSVYKSNEKINADDWIERLDAYLALHPEELDKTIYLKTSDFCDADDPKSAEIGGV